MDPVVGLQMHRLMRMISLEYPPEFRPVFFRIIPGKFQGPFQGKFSGATPSLGEVL